MRRVVVAGMPRAGTSWTGKALGLAEGYTYVREPDNFDHVPGATPDFPFRYVRGGDQRHGAYRRHLERALDGRITTPFTMKEDLGPFLRRLPPRWRRPLGARFPALYWTRRDVVVKLVHSNLALGWILHRYPEARVVYVLRHPCGQFASVQRRGWRLTPERFLEDEALVREHLGENAGWVRRASTFWEQAGAQWGLVNLVVWRQALEEDRLAIVPFEWLCEDPVPRFRDVYAWGGLAWTPAVEAFVTPTASDAASDAPFSLSKDSVRQIDKWRAEVPEADVAVCRRFAEPFAVPFYDDFDPHAVSPVW